MRGIFFSDHASFSSADSLAAKIVYIIHNVLLFSYRQGKKSVLALCLYGRIAVRQDSSCLRESSRNNTLQSHHMPNDRGHNKVVSSFESLCKK